MTIDERLEKLTERHEALTQAVELIDVRLERIAKRHESLAHAVELMAIEGQRLAKSVQKRDPQIAALLQAVRSHERRLARPEGKF